MKQYLLQRLLVSFLFLTVSTLTWAHDFTINGIYYNKNSDGTSVTVTYMTSSDSRYSGSVTIPSQVTYIDKTYDVTSIGDEAFYYCSGLTSVTIPNSVTSIGAWAFSGCSGLTSLTIPNSVTSIGRSAFSSCSSLTSLRVEEGNPKYDSRNNCNAIIESSTNTLFAGCKTTTIPNSVTSIGEYAFYGCSELTSITIPNSVTSVGQSTFDSCNALEYVTIGNGVTGIEEETFENCYSLKSITIGNSVKFIGKECFKNCRSLTSIILPNSVTSIGNQAFFNCNSLTSVTIRNSVTSIGRSAFSGCSGLTSLKVEEGNPKYDSRNNCNAIIESSTNTLIAGCKTTTIPNSVTSIGEYAFYYCSGLTSVTIPNSVTSIGSSAFYGCSGLTSVTIPNSVTSIGGSAFSGCSGLTSVTCLAEQVPSTDTYLFSGVNTENATLYVPKASVKIYKSQAPWNSFGTIEAFRYYDIDGIRYEIDVETNDVAVIANSSNKYTGDIVIPSSIIVDEKEYAVTRVGDYAFSGCDDLTSLTVPYSVTHIGDYAFSGCDNAKFYANRGTDGLLALWNYGIEPFETGTTQKLPCPDIHIFSTTQTAIQCSVSNKYADLSYEINDEQVYDNEFTLSGLRPDYTQEISLCVHSANNRYRVSVNATTASISPQVNVQAVTASSISIRASYTKGDARVVSTLLMIGGKEFDSEDGTARGLTPNSNYTCYYQVIVEDDGGSTYTYEDSRNVTTAALNLTTLQPKVVNMGNVVVGAESNIDDDETKVGFEWRRTDWTEEFASNTGPGYLYNGMMEGYVRNLYIERLWKYRAYYETESGIRYYSEWVGIDPTNTNYYEPNVHTYSTVNVTTDGVEVKGYAMRGTDDITKQGFMYWENPQATTNARGNRVTSVPSNAKVVEVKGNIMKTTLQDLEHDTEYCCIAFITTSENETFYGELQTFRTETDETYIVGDANGNGEVEIGDVTSVLTLMATPEAIGYDKKAADANGNGEIEIGDVTTILTIMANGGYPEEWNLTVRDQDNNYVVPAEGGTKTVVLTTTRDVELSCSESWAHIGTMSYNVFENGKIYELYPEITFDANTTGEVRAATIYFNNGTDNRLSLIYTQERVRYDVVPPTWKGFDYKVKKDGIGEDTERGEIGPGDKVRVYCVRKSNGVLTGMIKGTITLKWTTQAEGPSVVTEMTEEVITPVNPDYDGWLLYSYADFNIPDGGPYDFCKAEVTCNLNFECFGQNVRWDDKTSHMDPYIGSIYTTGCIPTYGTAGTTENVLLWKSN